MQGYPGVLQPFCVCGIIFMKVCNALGGQILKCRNCPIHAELQQKLLCLFRMKNPAGLYVK